MATTVTQRIARLARRATRPRMSTRVVTSIPANTAEEEIPVPADPAYYDRANSASVPVEIAPVAPAASAATAPSSSPEEDIGLGEVDYEEPEEVLLSVGEGRTLIAKRLREVDSSGFVVGPSAIRFLEGSQTEIISFSRNYQNRKMTIAETSFLADVFDDSDLLYDEIVKDYSTIYDGVDISVFLENGTITYDSAESAELERKFWRINRQEAVYDNLLQADFNYSLLIEPPVVQTVKPEGIDISSFTSLIETSEAT